MKVNRKERDKIKNKKEYKKYDNDEYIVKQRDILHKVFITINKIQFL